jgi:AcrR family transcriptional regulator
MSSNDRREELVEAAIRVLVRDGVAKATTRAIAAEAGVSQGVIHYCFASRSELLQEVITRMTDRFLAPVSEAFAGGDDLRASIAGSLRAFWRRVEAAPAEELVGYELAQYALRNEDFGPLAKYQYAHYLEVHAQFLQAAAEAAGIEWTVPVPVLARHVHATLDGLSMCWLVDRDSEHTAQVLDQMTDYLVGCARERGAAHSGH